jgi:hypothetical protein
LATLIIGTLYLTFTPDRESPAKAKLDHFQADLNRQFPITHVVHAEIKQQREALAVF